ncbi:MAG: hypothetical protein K2H61_05220, partial [Muribaculaceae bacterium]|nr:hypothetical protein [Muribaculaceae bacterium]
SHPAALTPSGGIFSLMSKSLYVKKQFFLAQMAIFWATFWLCGRKSLTSPLIMGLLYPGL